MITTPAPRVLMAVANLPSLNTGVGGHYYSTRVILSALRERIPVCLAVIGHKIPDSLADLDDVILIPSRGIISLATIFALKQSLLGVEVLHCMDSASFLFGRLAAPYGQPPVIWTKCGGRTLRRYTPGARPDIVFHADDSDYYRQLGYEVPLIPNRVRLPKTTGVDRPRQGGPGPLRMVRISRICAKYEEGLLKAVAMARAARAADIDCVLDVIGYVEDAAVLSRLQSAAGEETRFYTSSDWTVRASRHLANYDVAIAGGRAAMEALAEGLPTFTTPTRSMAPILIDATNFDRLLSANMSERAGLSGNMETAITELRALAKDAQRRETYLKWAKAVTYKYLDIDAALDRYLTIYQGIATAGRRPQLLDLIKHWAVHHVGILSLRVRLRAIRMRSGS